MNTQNGIAVVAYTSTSPASRLSRPSRSSSTYKGIDVTTPGNICDTKNARRLAVRPTKRKRDSAYAAEHASATPTTVVPPATTTELKSCRPNSQRPALSCVVTTSTKFCSVTSVGSGLGDMANACDGDSAILSTHNTG